MDMQEARLTALSTAEVEYTLAVVLNSFRQRTSLRTTTSMRVKFPSTMIPKLSLESKKIQHSIKEVLVPNVVVSLLGKKSIGTRNALIICISKVRVHVGKKWGPIAH